MLTLAAIVAQADAEVGLTTSGIVVMAISILLVLGLAVFCIARILGEKRRETDRHVPLDINPHDVDT